MLLKELVTIHFKPETQKLEHVHTQISPNVYYHHDLISMT